MARVLFLTQVLPYPLDSGAKIRQFHMLQSLSAKHEVSLVSFVRSDNTAEHIARLRDVCENVHTVRMRRSSWRDARAMARSAFTGTPTIIARDQDKEMGRLLSQLVQERTYHIVHADQVSMAQYGLFARDRAQAMRGQAPKCVLDMHNAMYLVLQRLASDETHPVKRWLLRREAMAMARYEAAMCGAYDAVLTVTEQDRDLLLHLDRESEADLSPKLTAIPISVDPEEKAVVAHRDGPPTIIHLGTMFWPPNVGGVLWFAQEVLPLIWQEVPEARFIVAGKDPPQEIEDLGQDARIQVTGYVPDPLPYLEQADAFVVPLNAGGGMRVKILDAWLWGIPIIATPIGAEGINVRDGEDILIAETPRAFAAATVRAITDQQLNERMRAQGRAWVEANYSWRNVYGRVDQIYAKLLEESVEI